VLVTIERFVVVCHPLKARSLCTTTRTRLGVVFVFSFSVLYNFSRFFEYTYHTSEIIDEVIITLYFRPVFLNFVITDPKTRTRQLIISDDFNVAFTFDDSLLIKSSSFLTYFWWLASSGMVDWR
jgi:hypothetical protein